MDETLEITYSYTFQDRRQIDFPMVLKKETLSLLSSPAGEPPFWADLNFNRCSVCSLNPAEVKHCPIAVNLAPVVEAFKDFYSYESVQVVATTKERSYSKSATVQEGLSAMLGIIMVTSGCPVMERLKPMVRFHLPFAAMEETTYRMLSMYLMAQLYRHRKGAHADWELHGLDSIYQDVGAVNVSFAKRLRAAASKDANVNAMVNLDCLAKVVPFMVEELLEEMEGYFSALLAL
jgi:uncharacterized protein DUF6901